jgi:hypothetical protein
LKTEIKLSQFDIKLNVFAFSCIKGAFSYGYIPYQKQVLGFDPYKKLDFGINEVSKMLIGLRCDTVNEVLYETSIRTRGNGKY